ncbi:MAG: peptidoglycan-binding domain-containing protein [Syntrophales bacterium]|nr:peptidoglycan-binding domain-containing protein [Syntrophales bacterium]
MRNKLIAIFTGLMVATVLVVPVNVSALTAEELQLQINQLLNQLSSLQNQLSSLTGGSSGTVSGCTITSFDRNLSVTMTGNDVKCLQIVLNSSSDTKIAATGAGSPGNETTYFGNLTKAAVIKFQQKYASEVLTPLGLTAGTGFVGAKTRAKLNTMLAAGGEETGGETGGTTEPATTGDLTISLASDTPTASSIADNANGNFTKFKLKASSSGDVKISKIYVTRTGLAANGDVENIKIIDAETGVYKGSIGSLNADNRAMMVFTNSLVIPAGTTKEYYIRAGIVDGTSAGKTVKLGISSAADIISNADSVGGTFPIVGNPMTVVTLTIGSATVSEDGVTSDTKPDVGDTDVTIGQIKVAAGSTEAITIDSITVKKVGTADATDTGNIELYDVTNGKTLGTVATWNSEDKASWGNLNLVVAKGATQRFKVMADILDGPSLTVSCDIVEGSDVLMSVRGNTYGFYITPSRGSWNGEPTAAQTINAGGLVITKSSTTPPTGNISAGDSIPLAVFDFEAKGEQVKISALRLDFTLGTMVYTEVTNIAIYDENGIIAAGPNDLGSGSTVSYTDTFIVPVGIHKYTVKAKIADAVSTGDTIKVGVDRTSSTAADSGTITAVGMTSNSTIYPTPITNDVEANTLTVAAAALKVTTLDTPAARSVAVGTSNFIWATASLDAGSSGEKVLVSAITVTDTLNAAGDQADYIDNASLWADLTSANSARGDVYETKISNTEQPDDTAAATETQAFTLTQSVTVPKGSFVKVALVADLNAGASTDDKHTFTFTSATAVGGETGTSVTPTYTGSGQTMSNSTGGTLTVTADSSNPSANIILEGETATIAVFKLAASNVEDLDVDTIILNVTGGTSMNTVALYDKNDKLIQAAAGKNSIVFSLADGSLTIPANGYNKLKVKVTPLNVDNSVVTDGTSVIAKLVGTSANAYNIAATGLSSGTAITSSTAVSGNAMKLYETRPYFALSSSSPASGALIPQANELLAVFDVTAAAGGSVTFEEYDASSLTVSLSAVQGDTSSTSPTFTLKDEAGNTLDTATLNTAGGTKLSGYTSFTFYFGLADRTGQSFAVPPGETKKLYIYGDTRALGDAGDMIQLYLADTAANINWGIEADDGALGPTNKYGFTDGNIIFRGNIYGPTFQAGTGLSD